MLCGVTTEGGLTSALSDALLSDGCWHFIPYGPLQPVAYVATKPSSPNKIEVARTIASYE